MSKKDRQAVRENLANALEPPRRPPQKQNLDKLFEEFDDGKPLNNLTPVETPVATPVTAPVEPPISQALATPVPRPVTTPVATPVKEKFVSETIDSTHTASEQQVYSVMYRMTISQGNAERSEEHTSELQSH